MKRRYLILLDGALLVLPIFCGLMSRWMLSSMPPCVILTLTGWQCPSCGGTRCIRFLTQGHFLQALRVNPYLFFTVWIAAGIVLLLNIRVFTDVRWAKGLLGWLCRPALVIAWAVGFVLFGIMRNLI